MKEGREGANEQAKKEGTKEWSSMDAMRREWVYVWVNEWVSVWVSECVNVWVSDTLKYIFILPDSPKGGLLV